MFGPFMGAEIPDEMFDNTPDPAWHEWGIVRWWRRIRGSRDEEVWK